MLSEKVVPFPGIVLISILPPIWLTFSWTIARPRPRPETVDTVFEVENPERKTNKAF